jgi:hypothetical protein
MPHQANDAWLGIIEAVFDGLSSFAKLGSGFYLAISLQHWQRQPLVWRPPLARPYCTRCSVAGTWSSRASAEGVATL